MSKCPYCNDPRGIIYVDGIPEPCCDDIVANGGQSPAPLSGTCVNCNASHSQTNDDGSLAAVCCEECLDDVMTMITDQPDDRGGEPPPEDILALIRADDEIDAELNLACNEGYEGDVIPFWLEYAEERLLFTSNVEIDAADERMRRFDADPIPF